MYRVEHSVVRAVVVVGSPVFQTIVHQLARLVVIKQEAKTAGFAVEGFN